MNELLKKLRLSKFLTQEELAEKVGVKRTTITMLESDANYNTSVSTAKKLGEYFGIDWKLFFEKGE